MKTAWWKRVRNFGFQPSVSGDTQLFYTPVRRLARTGLATQSTFDHTLTEEQYSVIDRMATREGTRIDKMGLHYGAKSLLMFYTGKNYKLRETNYDLGQRKAEDNNVEHSLSVYPNPSSGHFQVTFTGGASLLNVFSATGQKVLSQNITNGEIIKLEAAPGMYMLELMQESKVEHMSLVIQ